MSTARSLLNYNMTVRHTRQGLTHKKTGETINLNQFKTYLLNQAEIFLETVPINIWVPIAMIPDNIRMEVIELLDQGTVTFREHSNYNHMKVVDNEDFSAFRLEPGVSTLKKEGFGI